MIRFSNQILMSVLLSCLITCTVQAGKPEDSSFSFRKKYKGEKFLLAGCGWDKVAVVDRRTCRFEWVHTIGKGEDCNDVEVTRERNILYAYTAGARLITPEQRVIWDYKVDRNEELFTATQLSDGGYLLAICGHPARIVELDKEGYPVKEIRFETGIKTVHDQFRQIEKTKRNTYLIPLFGSGELIEMNVSGQIINRVEVGGTPFSVKQLKRGKRLLVGCGDGHRWVEIDTKTWKIERSVTSDDLEGLSLLFVAELSRYGDGTTLLCNWNGHSKDKSQPKLVEIDRNNRIVWQLDDKGSIRNISAVWRLP
ncbi:hypothetical protein [uncultured Parabacteroides sp.]|uniref:beta-propeller domain-containing protein n=1 Tax=uncultured Parabacteroides sp. TaxID=512312 RepID=UPI0028061660|nr:hypothetical protein [uncultured Parabacteroides sp.]